MAVNPPHMRVLFITSSRLGDAVLSTGLLDHIVGEYPDAQITVVCGPLPVSLFDGLPGLARIIPLKKRKWNLHWFDLWRAVGRQRWDIVVDLRDSIVSRLIFARHKYIYSRSIDQKLHKVEQNASVMRLSQPPAPRLWPSTAQAQKARALIPDGSPVLGIGPTANWAGKTWSAENFIALVEKLTTANGILPGARVAVFAAPGEEDAARVVLASVPEARRIDVIAKTDPGTAAACLARCAFYIGNDSGLMHCAAAVGTPTLGLFGPSWPNLYRPWGKKTAFVQTPESYDVLKTVRPGPDGTLMGTLSVDAVLIAAENLAAEIGVGISS